ncbi:MAG: decaprenyl-phosphate phosphoribosyltransferase [Armatimonadetes bacterium]|nr:decaprenyl-phosphate phosphoribosyltransferase [Armatimonadota bacterium]MDW8121305.1 decaprenyl-phosphate phosphoribosyltransferase [Armatimonadota bacterium]
MRPRAGIVPQLILYLQVLRPYQWTKNALLFAGFIFAGRFLATPEEIVRELLALFLAFVSFCLLSGSVYTFNDLLDQDADRAHPIKKNRPIASGAVTIPAAVGLGLIAALLGFTAALTVDIFFAPLFSGLSILYLGWGIGYTLYLKKAVILDALAVAIGFVIRVVAGCWAIRVAISPWLILCTLLLSLFIAFCKRRHELLLLGNERTLVRPVLSSYDGRLLDLFIAISASLTLMAYSLYTFTAPHILLGNQSEPWLMITIPFVVYGIFRYLYLTYRTDIAGAPEKMFSDGPFTINLLAWVGTVLALGWFAR